MSEVLHDEKLDGRLYEVRTGTYHHSPLEVFIDGERLAAISRLHLDQASPTSQWDTPDWWAHRLGDEASVPVWLPLHVREMVLRVWADLREVDGDR